MSLPQADPVTGPKEEDRSGVVIGLTAFFMILTVSAVTVRFLVRVHKKNLWWDDWFMLAAILGTFVIASLDLSAIDFGFGRHTESLTENEFRKFLSLSWASRIPVFFVLTCTKVSICFFLLRIIAQAPLKRPLQVFIGFLLLSNFVLTVIWIAQCTPVRAAWDSRVQGKCHSVRYKLNTIGIQATISALSDFGFALYPILIISQVKMMKKFRVGLCVLMGLGLLTGAYAVARIVLHPRAMLPDPSYRLVTNWIWMSFEFNIGILAGCLPTLVPAYKTAKDWFIARTGNLKVKEITHIDNTPPPLPPKDVTDSTNHTRNRSTGTIEKAPVRTNEPVRGLGLAIDTSPNEKSIPQFPSDPVSPLSPEDVEKGTRQTIFVGMDVGDMSAPAPAAPALPAGPNMLAHKPSRDHLNTSTPTLLLTNTIPGTLPRKPSRDIVNASTPISPPMSKFPGPLPRKPSYDTMTALPQVYTNSHLPRKPSQDTMTPPRPLHNSFGPLPRKPSQEAMTTLPQIHDATHTPRKASQDTTTAALQGSGTTHPARKPSKDALPLPAQPHSSAQVPTTYMIWNGQGARTLVHPAELEELRDKYDGEFDDEGVGHAEAGTKAEAQVKAKAEKEEEEVTALPQIPPATAKPSKSSPEAVLAWQSPRPLTQIDMRPNFGGDGDTDKEVVGSYGVEFADMRGDRAR